MNSSGLRSDEAEVEAFVEDRGSIQKEVGKLSLRRFTLGVFLTNRPGDFDDPVIRFVENVPALRLGGREGGHVGGGGFADVHHSEVELGRTRELAAHEVEHQGRTRATVAGAAKRADDEARVDRDQREAALFREVFDELPSESLRLRFREGVGRRFERSRFVPVALGEDAFVLSVVADHRSDGRRHHDPLDAGGRSEVAKHVLRPLHCRVHNLFLRVLGAKGDRRGRVHGMRAPGEGLLEAARLQEVACDELELPVLVRPGPQMLRFFRIAWVPHNGAHVVSPIEQLLDDVRTEVSGGAGDCDLESHARGLALWVPIDKQLAFASPNDETHLVRWQALGAAALLSLLSASSACGPSWTVVDPGDAAQTALVQGDAPDEFTVHDLRIAPIRFEDALPLTRILTFAASIEELGLEAESVRVLDSGSCGVQTETLLEVIVNGARVAEVNEIPRSIFVPRKSCECPGLPRKDVEMGFGIDAPSLRAFDSDTVMWRSTSGTLHLLDVDAEQPREFLVDVQRPFAGPDGMIYGVASGENGNTVEITRFDPSDQSLTRIPCVAGESTQLFDGAGPFADQVDGLLVVKIGGSFELARFDGAGCMPLGPITHFRETPPDHFAYFGTDSFGFSSTGNGTLRFWRNEEQVDTAISDTAQIGFIRSREQIWAREVRTDTAFTEFASQMTEVAATDTEWGRRFFVAQVETPHTTCFRRSSSSLLDTVTQQGVAHVVVLENAIAVANNVSVFLFSREVR